MHFRFFFVRVMNELAPMNNQTYTAWIGLEEANIIIPVPKLAVDTEYPYVVCNGK